MELRHLRYFIAVAEELHFGRAALRLGISQPPLSQQIRVLEEELGVFLFERTSRRVALTPVGQSFLEEARQTVDHAARAMTVAQRAHRGELGRVALGFSASAPLTTIVSQALFAFRNAYPDVRLDLAEMSSDAQIEALHQGQLDAAFLRAVTLPPLPPGLVASRLLDESPLVALRSDHPLALLARPLRVSDLEGQPFVVYEYDRGGGITEHVVGLCRAAGFEPEIAVVVRGLGTLIGMVSAGVGLTILSRSLTVLRPENVVYREFDQSPGSNTLWLIHREQPGAIDANLLRIVEAERLADIARAGPNIILPAPERDIAFDQHAADVASAVATRV